MPTSAPAVDVAATTLAPVPPMAEPGITATGELGTESDPKRRSIRELLRSEPTRLTFLLAAFVYAIPGMVQPVIDRIPLPYDSVYNAVIYLMWSGTTEFGRQFIPLLGVVALVHTLASVVLVAVAVLPRDAFFSPLVALGRRFYRYALALPLYTLVLSNLPRPVANLVYAATRDVTWDITPAIARIEGPVIEWLQLAFASPGLSAIASDFYSILWLLPTGFAGFILVARDHPRALNRSIVAFVLTSLLAVPFFVLLPTFDPWSTNALYGATGTTTDVLYLYANADGRALTAINRQLHWAAGSALPSLHVAFPLVLAFVFRREGLRWLSILMGTVAALTALDIVYLGRHWIVDIVAAVPFSMAIAALAARVPFDVTLGPPGAWARFRKPAAAAATADADAVDSVNWLSGVFFVSGFAALLYQIVWQRTLFGIIGLNIESVTLVVTVFMLGLGIGSLVGGALSNRPNAPLPLLFALVEIGIGLFGLVSLSVFQIVGRATLGMSSTGTAVSTYLVLLVPTMLMGATLPLLVANQVRTQRNVGQAVGRLYFMNTLGSAAAAVAAALLLLGRLGQSGTVQVAALLNIAVGALVLVRARTARAEER